MSISSPFIQRPLGTILLAVGIAILGILSLLQLPVSALPRAEIPVILVSISQPGADPETMASSVVSPLERRLSEVAGVTDITSTSSQGNARIILQFDLSRSTTSIARDVQAAISAARPDLPSGLPTPPQIRKINPADQPVLILALTAPSLTPTALYDAADSIAAQRLAQVPGVAQVQVGGSGQPSIRVQANPQVLASQNLSLESLRQSISSANVLQPLGMIQHTEGEWMVDSTSHLHRLEDYQNIVVKTENGTIVSLKTIATVENGALNRRQGAWKGRENAVLLIISKQPEANVIDVVDGIYKRLEDLKQWLPASVEVDVLTDRSGTIRASVEEVEIALGASIGLVILVVAIFLRRLAPIVATAIAVPLSLLGTLAVMWGLGYSLNNLSLMALTVSVGFVVDDAIVMVENMARFREKGLSRKEAALQGAKHISFTIISITVSLLAVLLPLFAMSGIVGRLFREFSVTLAIAVLISGVLSLTLTPTLAAKLDHDTSTPPSKWGIAFDRIFSRIIARYIQSLRRVLQWKKTAFLAFFLSLVGMVFLFTQVEKGFFPEQNTGLISGSIRLRPDAPFRAMVEAQRQVVDILLQDPEILKVGINAGGGGPRGGGSNQAQIYITLATSDKTVPNSQEVITRLRPKLQLAGIDVFLQPVQDLFVGGRGGNAQYQYVLLSADLERLQVWSQRFLEKLRSLPSFQDVSAEQETPTRSTKIVIDRQAAARYGVDINTISQILNNGFSQRQISTIYEPRNQYRVVLEMEPSMVQGQEVFQTLYFPGTEGRLIPFSSFAQWTETSESLQVDHQKQFPATTLSFNVAPGFSLSQAATALQQAAVEISMPSDIRGEFSGNAKAFRDFQRDQVLLLIAAFVSIYIVLGVLYESFLHPLTILSTLPTAGLGAVLALYMSHTPLTIVAFIGIILLMGIVKKNAILIVDFALEHQRLHNASPKEAVMLACEDRFRPILMTTLAAVMGAVPLVVSSGAGAELRYPLGMTLIGGLLVSQLFTLYSTPLLYLALDTAGKWAKGSSQNKTSEATPNKGLE